MVSISKIFLSMLLLIDLLQFKSSNCIHLGPPRVHLSLTNKLSGNLELGVHCKDKHHDLGFQTLGPGQTYSFTLKPNFLANVVDYWCLFNWNSDSEYFDVYVQERDNERCHKICVYEIHQSGPCRIYEDYPNCYPWNSKVVIAERQLGEEDNTLN